MKLFLKIIKIVVFIILSLGITYLMAWFASFQDIQINQFSRAALAFIVGITFYLFKWKKKYLLLFLSSNILLWVFGLYVNPGDTIEFSLELIFVYLFGIVGYSFLRVSIKSILCLIGAIILLLVSGLYLQPYLQIRSWEDSNVESGIIEAVGNDLQKEYFLDKDSNLAYMDQFKDDVVLIDLWNSGCIACYKKYKMLIPFAEEYKDKSVKFLIVFSSDTESFEDFIRELGKRKMQDYPNIIKLYDPTLTICNRFGIDAFPVEMIVYNDTIRHISSGYGDDLKWLIKRNLRKNIDMYLK